MDVDVAPEESEFRDEVRQWLDEHLVGDFAAHRGVGSPTDDTAWDVRVEWEKELAAGGWLGLTWPEEYGGRGASWPRRSCSSPSTRERRRPPG